MRGGAAWGLWTASLGLALSGPSCGGKTIAARSHGDGGASEPGDASGPGSSGGRGPLPRDAQTSDRGPRAEAATPDAGSPSPDAPPPPDARPDSSIAPVPEACRDPSGVMCSGDKILRCDESLPEFDCATELLASTHPTAATCTRTRAGGAVCAVPPGGTCWTVKGDEPLPLTCLGESSGCSIRWDDSSVCVEHLGTCADVDFVRRCAGRYLIDHCLNGQPLGYDCTQHSAGATCGESDDGVYCESIGEGGACDANADGSSEVGWAVARCAPGLRCVGALDSTRPGACQASNRDPCAVPSKRACDGHRLLTCTGGAPEAIDCDTYFLDAAPGTRATCATFGGVAECAAYAADVCRTAKNGEPMTLPCLGHAPACVTSGDYGECSDFVGTCEGTGPMPPVCFGTKRALSCRQGQPQVFECSSYTSGLGTCGSDGERNWCNVREHGGCDSNADGSSEVGRSEYRCNAGLTCVGAKLADGGVETGLCRPSVAREAGRR